MTETLGQRLDRLVKEAKAVDRRASMKGISLAAKQGETYVRDIIKGRSKNPKLSGLIAVAKQLGIPIDHLVQPEDMVFIENDIDVRQQGLEDPATRYLYYVDGANKLLDDSQKRGERDEITPLDRMSMAMIIAGALHAKEIVTPTPTDDQLVRGIFRAHDWFVSELRLGREHSADEVLNFLRHTL